MDKVYIDRPCGYKTIPFCVTIPMHDPLIYVQGICETKIKLF